MSLLYKRTKILATVGPATNTKEAIHELNLAGVNGFRLNFSHGSNEERIQQIEWIRETSKKTGKPVAILQDLQGPKIRLGIIKDNRLDVKKGDILTLDFALEEHKGDLTVPVQYNLAEKVKIGEAAYIFDGKVKTTVTEISSNTAIKVRIENDGYLMSRKGFNLPDTDFGGDILTPKDLKDIEFGATLDLDYIALSFVQSAEDINNMRQVMATHGHTAQVIAKVETKASIVDKELIEIVKVSDGIMVARGDLAVEAGAELVPVVQRRIVELCRKYGKLCIIATQMMMSMVDAPEPTRAEVSDVANAVIQGADVVMLSDETANGNYPLETIAVMKKIILYTQDNVPVSEVTEMESRRSDNYHAISTTVVDLAKRINASFIVCETKTGTTASAIASMRPNMPIVTLTSEQRTANQLALCYANRGYVEEIKAGSGLKLAQSIKKQGLLGDTARAKVVIVNGRLPGLAGETDTIQIRSI